MSLTYLDVRVHFNCVELKVLQEFGIADTDDVVRHVRELPIRKLSRALQSRLIYHLQ